MNDLIDLAHHTGDGRVGALSPALGAAGALLRNELRHLEADVRHVADGACGGRNGAQGREGIGDPVVAGPVHGAYLLPKPTWVADTWLHLGAVQDGGHDRRDAHFVLGHREGRGVERLDFIESPPDDAQVVLHHPLTAAAEFLGHLSTNAVEQLGFVQSFALDEPRDLEERAHEGRALHSVAEIGRRSGSEASSIAILKASRKCT